MVKHFSGFQVDQAEAKFFGTAAQTVDEPCAVEFQISAGPRILIGEVVAQDPVDQDCKFAGGGGDDLGLAQPVRPGGDNKLPVRWRCGSNSWRHGAALPRDWPRVGFWS
jgi:hypothetical protein